MIFTEPGSYTVHLEGTIEDTEVHTHFEKNVQDRTELEYPDNGSRAADDGTESQTDESGFGTASIALVAIGVVAITGVALRRYRR